MSRPLLSYENMNHPIPVIITGAAGRMGREAIRAITHHQATKLQGALTRSTGLGQDAGTLVGLSEPLGIILQNDLTPLLQAASEGTVLVELTKGQAAFEHVQAALKHKIPVVVGATGLSDQQIKILSEQAKTQACGVLLAPNFSLGALLMMRFAAAAAPYFSWAEIIEKHHQKKVDAPSGTAKKTADMILAANPEMQAANMDFASRGELISGVPVHSVRLPGLLAHQEVIFGGQGECLTLKHDSLDRSCFMPGLLMAIDRVQALDQLVYGLEHLI